MEFHGAVGTTRCWMLPCPSCLVGWVPIVPDGTTYGYRLASEVGCSGDFSLPDWPDNGCEPEHVAWWAAWRAGELPPPMAVDQARARAYAQKVVASTLKAIPARPEEGNLRAAAYTCGSWAKAGSLPVSPIAKELMRRASGVGLDPNTLAPKLAAAFRAGMAVPARMPR
jgi:hypothetical protein